MGENPYTKTVWQPHILEVDEFKRPVIDPSTGKQRILSHGTTFTSQRANNFENGIYNLYDLMAEQKRINQRQDVRFLLMDRSSSGNVFYDTMDGQAASKATLDVSRADITEVQSVGATTLPVSNTSGFVAFTEVTVFDDVNSEDVMIMAIDTGAKTITVEPLENSYKKGATIARSNVVIDSVQGEMQIGSWGTYDISLVEVV